MCGGGGQEREKVRAENQQKILDQQAKNKQKDLDQLAANRNALAQQQQAQSVAMQRQFSAQQSAQTTKVEGLQAEQAEMLGGIRSRGTAVSQSLQILGQVQPKAPTASQTAGSKTRGAKSTATNIARGSTRNRGPNLSI